MSSNKITGVILAGGRSSRMGEDKGLMIFKGQAMVQYAIAALEPLCGEVLISTNNEIYAQFGRTVVPDVHHNCGPIGGLYAAMQQAKNEAILVVPCDMPHVTPILLQKIISSSKANPRKTVVVGSEQTGRIYPTLGMFYKEIAPMIEQQIMSGNNKLMCLLDKVQVHTVSIFDEMALQNYNAPTDLIPSFDNMILIAGNGRNVGKTLLACRIIKELSLSTCVTAVKVSSHFHALDPNNPILVETEKYTISKETLQNNKDSSRMLQAGAKKVYYVQCHNEYLSEMFRELRQLIPHDTPVVIESGGLYNHINPKVFYFIQDPHRESICKKKALREGENKTVLLSEQVESINVTELLFPTLSSFDVR